MRLLVVGAGASYAEARHAGLPEELHPPLVKNFAAKLWSDYNPHYLLSDFLIQRGYEPSRDARKVFIELERLGITTVEEFFEYAYHNRDLILPGHERFDPSSEYDNLIYHGILRPLSFLLIQGLLRPGPHKIPMVLAQKVVRHLQPNDVVLNLNYDTVFETGALQANHKLVFLPNSDGDCLLICKPHGSVNLYVYPDQEKFYFAEPLFVGSVQPSNGSRNYLGIVPPRLNKQYDQHPVARTIIDSVRDIAPEHIIYWGVSLADNDADLADLYKKWSTRTDRVEFINPSIHDVERAKELLGINAQQYFNIEEWEANQYE